MDVGGNDGAAARHFAAHEFRIDLLAPGDELHLLGDHALARVMHLRNISIPVGRRIQRPLVKPTISYSHASPSKLLCSRNLDLAPTNYRIAHAGEQQTHDCHEIFYGFD